VARLIDKRLGTEYYIVTDTATIGRHASNDMVFLGPMISRFHAKIVHADGQYCIRDLGSTYGTYVNRVRVRPDANVLTPLPDGAAIHLGVPSTLDQAAYELTFSAAEVPHTAAEEIRKHLADRKKLDAGRCIIETRGKVLVVTMVGAFREPECEVVAGDIAACVEHHPRHVVVDLAGVTHLNTYATVMFIQLRDRLKESGVRIVLSRATGRVLELLRKANLHDLFLICDTPEEAYDSLTGTGRE
jgi:anti-anti-sigma factor